MYGQGTEEIPNSCSLRYFSFPLVSLQGCTELLNPISKLPEFNETLTQEDGKAVLSTNFGTINALVQDENGLPLPDATISSYELEDGVLVVASREDAAPSFRFVDKGTFSSSSSSALSESEPQLAIVTLVFTLVVLAEVALDIYDYTKNPGEIPIQIPGILEGSRKVQKTCLQIDANDILAIGNIITSLNVVSKAIKVLTAPPRIRGVTAINLGFTKKKLMEYMAWKIGERVFQYLDKYLGLLDRDIINTCKYVYRDTKGNEYPIPLQKWEIIDASEAARKLLKQFWIYVHNTKVKKGWDWIVMPDGSTVTITPGKYMRIEEIEQGKKWRIGFEDLTEELGHDYTVDYDYDDPLLEIELIKTRQLLIRGIRFEGTYQHDLYVMGQIVYGNFGGGSFENFGEWVITFSIPAD